MFTQFLDLAPSMPVVTLALVGLAILVLVRVPGAGRSTGYPAGFCALAAFGFTILVFLTTPLGFQWHMDRAFDRIVVHGCWLAVAAGLLHLISGDLATSGSKVAPGPDGPS